MKFKKYLLYALLCSYWYALPIKNEITIIDDEEYEALEQETKNDIQKMPTGFIVKNYEKYLKHLSEKMKRHENNSEKIEEIKNKQLHVFIHILEFSDIFVEKNILENLLDIFFQETKATPNTILPSCRHEYFFRFNCNLSLLQLAHFDATVGAVNRKKGNEVLKSLLKRGGNPDLQTSSRNRTSSTIEDNEELCIQYCKTKKNSECFDDDKLSMLNFFQLDKDRISSLNCQNVQKQKEMLNNYVSRN